MLSIKKKNPQSMNRNCSVDESLCYVIQIETLYYVKDASHKRPCIL